MSALPAFGAAAKPLNVRVGLPGRLSFNWPLYVAVERGIFHQEGLNVELIVLRSATVQTQAILAGDLQVNLNAVDSVARAVVAGAPLRFVGSAQEKPAFRMIAAKEIKGWADLRGKVLATGVPGGLTHSLMLAMLEANGLKKGDFQLLSMGSGNERIHAIRGGRVQGTLLSPPDDFSILDEGFRSLGFVGDYLKDVQFNGYSVTQNWASENGDTLVVFLRAVIGAISWLHNPANKEDAMKIHAKYIPLKREWLEKIYDLLIRQKMLSTNGRPNMKGIENLLQVSVKYGVVISSIPALEKWVDLSYLEKAAATSK
jgi:ABC-type nitrate/sulfonate/bicarbonate transport system substrate-binding protein